MTMPCQHRATALLKHTNPRKKSTLAQRVESENASSNRSPPPLPLLLLFNYLLRRRLVQRHGASAAAARGQSAQVRAPRSPRQGGHEVSGHCRAVVWRRTRRRRQRESGLCFLSFFCRFCSLSEQNYSTRLSISISHRRLLSLSISISRSRSRSWSAGLHHVAARRSPRSATGASAPRPQPPAEDRHARPLRGAQRPFIHRLHSRAAAGQRGLRVPRGRRGRELLRLQAARGRGGGFQSWGEALG